MAVISLARHPDPERFVAEFCGSERNVAGYLLAEVLERQPPEVRDLLLRTSLLERVSGPLADALTGGTGSEAILQRLEDASAFVTSLDVGRTWFRYHHLLADLLQLELRRTVAGARSARCTAWRPSGSSEHGYVVEAIRHAQAARDWPHAARLLADNYVGPGVRRPQGDACARCSPPSRPTRPRPMPSLRSRSPRRRLYDGILDESADHIAVAERLADDGVRRSPAALRPAAEQRTAVAGVPARRSRHARGRRCAPWKPQPRQHAGTEQRPSRLGADEPRHRRALVAAIRRRAPPPRGGAGARSPHRAAVSGDRLPRPPGARGCPGRLAGPGRPAVQRGGGDDRRGSRMGNASDRRPGCRGGRRCARLARPPRRGRAVAGRVERAQRRRRDSEMEPVSTRRAASCGSGRAGSRKRWRSSAPRSAHNPRSRASTRSRRPRAHG